MNKSKAPALAKGLAILDLIRVKGNLSFSELQMLTKDNPASLSRYLHTLIEKNYLIKNQFQQYELGLKLLDLKDNKSIWPRLKEKCLPYLKEINHKYGVTVLLLAYSHDTYMAIDKVIALDNLGMMEKNSVGQNDFTSIWTNLFYQDLKGHSLDSFFRANTNSEHPHPNYLMTRELFAETVKNGYLTYLSNHNEIYRLGIPIRYQGQVIATIGIGTFVNQLNSVDRDKLISNSLDFSKKLSLSL